MLTLLCPTQGDFAVNHGILLQKNTRGIFMLQSLLLLLLLSARCCHCRYLRLELCCLCLLLLVLPGSQLQAQGSNVLAGLPVDGLQAQTQAAAPPAAAAAVASG
jgi:hypothetical protein